jgi:long-chain acyl-CoA synthetase
MRGAFVSTDIRHADRTEIDEAVAATTLVDVLRRNAASHPTAPAIHWKQGDDWKLLNWAEYRQVALEAAAGMMTLGVESGDVVAIQAGNRPEHLIADLGAIHAGGAGVTLYGTLAPSQISYIVNDCDAKVAILEDETNLARWRSVLAEMPGLRHIVMMSGTELPDAGDTVIGWTELIDRGKKALLDEPQLVESRTRDIEPNDVATMIYTSGTTGFPKGVVFSHRNLLWTAESSRRGFGLPDNLRLVSYLPMAHIAERMASHYLGLWLACQVFYCSDQLQILDYITHARPQAFLGVPRVWEKFQNRLLGRFAEDRRSRLIMYAVRNGEKVVRARQQGRSPVVASLLAAVFDRLVFSKVRANLGMDELVVAVTTAAPSDPDMIVFFNALGIPLCELYGLSESSGPAVSNLPGANRIGTVGKPLPGVEIQLAQDGEVLIRGGNVAAGYHRLADDTAQTFDDRGWLHTGDLGSIDADGFLSIVGRKKDIIITAAGKNIAPSPIEVSLKSHHPVSYVCVVGDTRPYLTALIAFDPEEARDWAKAKGLPYEDLARFTEMPQVMAEMQLAVDEVNRKLSRVEQIKKFVIVPDEWIPESGNVTPSLKVRRMLVMEKYSGVIDQMYQG